MLYTQPLNFSQKNPNRTGQIQIFDEKKIYEVIILQKGRVHVKEIMQKIPIRCI